MVKADGRILSRIYKRFSREKGFPAGLCSAVADEVEKQLEYPRVDGHVIIGGDRYGHSWNEDRSEEPPVIVDGGTARQFNDLLRLSGIRGFRRGPLRIRQGDRHYGLFVTSRTRR